MIRGKPFLRTFNIPLNKIEEYNVLGWILSEGSLLSTNYRFIISQKNKKCLEILKEKIEQCFSVDSGMSIIADGNCWQLQIGVPRLKNYFNEHYSIPLGKKSKIIKVPRQVFLLNEEAKIAFITGYLEGDGSFTFYWRFNKTLNRKYKVPRINISSNSRSFLEDMKLFLSEFGYSNKLYKDGEGFKLCILKCTDCAKLFFKIFPYMIHEDKINDFKSILSYSEILYTIRIKNSGILLKQFKRIHNKTWKEMVNIISKNFIEFNFNTIRNWSYNCFSIPLAIVIWLCDKLKEDYFNFIPKELSGLLWIHGKINKKEFLKLRERFCQVKKYENWKRRNDKNQRNCKKNYIGLQSSVI